MYMIVCVPVIVCVTFSIKTKSITHNSSPSSASRSDPGQKMSDAHKELVMKKSLFNFLNSIPGSDLNAVAVDIDEIVLSYITSVLEESTQDPCFDVDGFIEMMSGFFPEVSFSRIASADVCTWLFTLEAELSAVSSAEESVAHGAVEREISLSPYLAELSLSAATPATATNTPPLKKERVQLLSETSDCGSTDSSTFDFFSEECDLLQEMFPDSTPLEVKQCVTIANGCMEKAIQILLYRQENDEAILCSKATVVTPKSLKVDEKELKTRIIERYSYVDKNAQSKEYRPVVPKVEPKKMVRYLDNKVVSLRGERFTEVRRGDEDKEPAELKKPKKAILP